MEYQQPEGPKRAVGAESVNRKGVCATVCLCCKQEGANPTALFDSRDEEMALEAERHVALLDNEREKGARHGKQSE